MSKARKLAYILGGIVGLGVLVSVITGGTDPLAGLIMLAAYAAFAFGAVKLNERKGGGGGSSGIGRDVGPGSDGGRQ